MPSNNLTVAAQLEELADLLEVQGDDPFRVRAVRTAARVVAQQPPDYAERIARGEVLARLPGVGHDLNLQVLALMRNGRCELLERMRATVAPGTAALLKVPGLGPHRVRVLVQTLGIQTPEDLLAAARSGQIREVVGFGPRTEQRVLEALEGEGTQRREVPLAAAQAEAERLLGWLRSAPWVQHAELAGGVRRGLAKVESLHLVATGDRGAPIAERFVHTPGVAEVLVRGPRRAVVLLAQGVQAELRVVAPGSYGAALLHLTGSREFIAELRGAAAMRGLRLSDHGIYEGLRRVAGDSEQAMFAALGLPYIEPAERTEGRVLPGGSSAVRAGGSGALDLLAARSA